MYKKLAEELLDDNTKEYLKSTGANLEGLTGAMLLNSAYHGGDLTGRESLYHGTSAKSKKGILEKGILPTTRENSVMTVDVLGGTNKLEKALGKSYMARNIWEAIGYALKADAAGRGIPNPTWQQGKLKNIGIVRINAPTWKMKNIVLDPMYDVPYDEFVKDRELNHQWRKATGRDGGVLRSLDEIFSNGVDWYKGSKLQKGIKKLTDITDRTVYDTGGKYVVVNGTTPTKYIRGSKDYQGLTLDEFKDYVSHNKGRFAGGIAKSLIGAGLLGNSIYNIVNILKDRKKREEESVIKDGRTLAQKAIDDSFGPLVLSDEERKVLEQHYGLPENSNMFLRHLGRNVTGSYAGLAAGTLGGVGIYKLLHRIAPTTARLLFLPSAQLGMVVGATLANQKYSKDNVIRIMRENAEKEKMSDKYD